MFRQIKSTQFFYSLCKPAVALSRCCRSTGLWWEHEVFDPDNEEIEWGASSVERNKLTLFTSLHDELHWIILHNPVHRPIFRAQQKFMQKVIFHASRFVLESPSISLRDAKDATQASQRLIYFTEIPSSGLMLPEYNRTETVGTTPNKHVSTRTHWATWRQILLLQVSLPSLAFRWDCTEKEEEGRKKCPLLPRMHRQRRGGWNTPTLCSCLKAAIAPEANQ